jgi:hypothetical protein
MVISYPSDSFDQEAEARMGKFSSSAHQAIDI